MKLGQLQLLWAGESVSPTVGLTALTSTLRQREAERIREEHLQREREAAKQEQRKLAYLQVGLHVTCLQQKPSLPQDRPKSSWQPGSWQQAIKA